MSIDTCDSSIELPPSAVRAAQNELAHNNTYGFLPLIYVDKVVVCRDCAKEEVWSAENQKWWYEVAKGNINTEAVRCRACRNKEKVRKDVARKEHIEGLAKKNET